jgi:hypothetical protein
VNPDREIATLFDLAENVVTQASGVSKVVSASVIVLFDYAFAIPSGLEIVGFEPFALEST